MGLAICGRLVELMGGEIIVNSEPDVGSEFVVSVPIWNFKTQTKHSIFPKAKLFYNTDSQNKLKWLANKLSFFIETIETESLSNLSKCSPDELNIALITQEQDISSLPISQLNNTVRLLTFSQGNVLNKLKERLSETCVLDINTLTFYSLHKCISRLKRQPLHQEPVLQESDFSIDLDSAESLLGDLRDPEEQAPLLLVEDSPFNQKLMIKQLSRLGYQCDLASDGRLQKMAKRRLCACSD